MLASELLEEPPRPGSRVGAVRDVRHADEEVVGAGRHDHLEALRAPHGLLDEEHSAFPRAAAQQLLRTLPDEVPAQVG